MKRTDRELLEDALKLIEYGIRGGKAHDITEEIRARLAEKDDEPVAWASTYGYGRVYLSYIVARHSSHGKEPLPLYRHPRQPVRLSDEEILAIAEKYGTSETRHRPTYHLHNGEPTGETYPITDWGFGQDDLLGFARELLDKNQ